MNILLTGATGLVGSVLLADLLRRGQRVIAVARCRGLLGAEARIARILAAQGEARASEGLVVTGGEPAALRAAIEQAGGIDAAIHAAAAVKFSADREELLRTNVGGAAQLLEALDACAPGAHFHFISTAYVCGDRPGTCREDEGDLGQGFRQPYEQTKLLAEGVVRDSCGRSGRPFTVYRPSIVCGSFADGSAANFHGLSSFLKAFDSLARLRARKPGIAGTLRIPCAAEGTKNVVPVDWLAAAICALVERPAPGRTYHLTHDRPLQHVEIREAIREVIGWQEIELSPPDGDLPLGAAQGILGATLRHFEPYLRVEPTFDRTALAADLGDLASPPPLDRRYLERIVAFGRSVGWEPRPFERADLDAVEPSPTHRRPSCASC